MGELGVTGLMGDGIFPVLLIVLMSLLIFIAAVEAVKRLIPALAFLRRRMNASGAASDQTTDHARAAETSLYAASGIPQETVAVISAAVATVMAEAAPGASYTVTSVKRARERRPVWGFAGMQQDTRPF